MFNRVVPGLLVCLVLLGCNPRGPIDSDSGGPDTPAPDAAGQPADLSPRPPGPPDLVYACGVYSAYRARTEGVVRSPCDYDVSKILSIGGDVKTRIRPPTITMDFPDGTNFTGPTDGMTFTAVRTTKFKYTDGCNWQATETLRGTIDQQNMCLLHADYTYREAPVSPGPCAMPCTIDAKVTIERVGILVE